VVDADLDGTPVSRKVLLERQNHEVLVRTGQKKASEPIESLAYATLATAFFEMGWAKGDWIREAGALDLGQRLVSPDRDRAFPDWPGLKGYLQEVVAADPDGTPVSRKVLLERQNREVLVRTGQKKASEPIESLTYAILVAAFFEMGCAEGGWGWEAGALDRGLRLEGYLDQYPPPSSGGWDAFRTWYLTHRDGLGRWNKDQPGKGKGARKEFLAPATVAFALREIGFIPRAMVNSERASQLNYALRHEEELVLQLEEALQRSNLEENAVMAFSPEDLRERLRPYFHPERLVKSQDEGRVEGIQRLRSAYQQGADTVTQAAAYAGISTSSARRLWPYVTGKKQFVAKTYKDDRRGSFNRLLSEFLALRRWRALGQTPSPESGLEESWSLHEKPDGPGAGMEEIQWVFHRFLERNSAMRRTLEDRRWVSLQPGQVGAFGYPAVGGFIIADSAKITDAGHAVIADEDLGNELAEKTLAWIKAGKAAAGVVKNARLMNVRRGDLLVFEEELGLTAARIEHLLAENGIEGAAAARAVMGDRIQVKALPLFAFQLFAGEDGLPPVVVLSVAVQLRDEAGNTYTLILMA
jgi:hypothetical protein